MHNVQKKVHVYRNKKDILSCDISYNCENKNYTLHEIILLPIFVQRLEQV